MNEVIGTACMLLLGVVVFALVTRRAAAWERPWLAASFAAHIVSAFAMILLTIYFFGGGDMLAYHKMGSDYADYLRTDFAGYAPDMLRYALRRPTQEHTFFMGDSATGAMMGVSAWLMFFLGDSLYAACLLIAVGAFVSKYALYRGFMLSLPARYKERLLWSAMLLPSVVFWSSGLLKEPIALLGFGPAFLGMAMVIRGERWGLGAALLAAGAVPVGVMKPYVLFPFLFCSGIWFYWHRSLTQRGSVGLLKRPMYLAAAAVLSLGGVQALSVVFPEFGVAQIAEEAAELQAMGQRVRGGSHYAITSTPARGLVGQLLLAPVGLAFALFRPLPFDVRNAVVLLNALEMLAIMWLWWRAGTIRSVKQTARMVFASPVLVFCVAFCVIFGAAVGLSSTNIGTLSRYRVPMMPFYVLTLLVLAAPQAPRSGRGV
jgi:hypothetical protein